MGWGGIDLRLINFLIGSNDILLEVFGYLAQVNVLIDPHFYTFGVLISKELFLVCDFQNWVRVKEGQLVYSQHVLADCLGKIHTEPNRLYNVKQL